jgi:hypothetical protein
MGSVRQLVLSSPPETFAATKTWDGKYATENIEVTVVYSVSADRGPLLDWRERVDDYCRRIKLFHKREFQGQSNLRTVVHPAPFHSESPRAVLRRGDANEIYLRTMSEVDRLWGYFQVRSEPEEPPQPYCLSPDLIAALAGDEAWAPTTAGIGSIA